LKFKEISEEEELVVGDVQAFFQAQDGGLGSFRRAVAHLHRG